MEQSQSKLIEYINSLEVPQVEHLIKLYENKGNQLIADKRQLIKDYQRIMSYITIEENFESEEDYFIFNGFKHELEINRKQLDFYVADLKLIRKNLKLRTKKGVKNDK